MSGAALVYVGARRVGSVKAGIFHKTIHGSKHILRYPTPAIALDLESLARAQDLGALAVCVKDIESGVTYTAQIEHIRTAGLELDRGFGRQIALPLAGWVKSGKGSGETAKQLSFA